METLWEELIFGLPDRAQTARVVIRLTAATLLGGIIGFQRERIGKPAGLRTHILVTLGTTLFIIACSGFGMNSDGLSRVIQGIATGIGFIGAGTILKLSEERDIQGLTTSAGIWMTATIGVAIGLGALGLALIATLLAWIVLTFAAPLEQRINKKKPSEEDRV